MDALQPSSARAGGFSPEPTCYISGGAGCRPASWIAIVPMPLALAPWMRTTLPRVRRPSSNRLCHTVRDDLRAARRRHASGCDRAARDNAAHRLSHIRIAAGDQERRDAVADRARPSAFSPSATTVPAHSQTENVVRARRRHENSPFAAFYDVRPADAGIVANLDQRFTPGSRCGLGTGRVPTVRTPGPRSLFLCDHATQRAWCRE